jgi:hypothetical protein
MVIIAATPLIFSETFWRFLWGKGLLCFSGAISQPFLCSPGRYLLTGFHLFPDDYETPDMVLFAFRTKSIYE